MVIGAGSAQAGFPSWFNRHGGKMKIAKKAKGYLLIRSSAGYLEINALTNNKGYKITWGIRFAKEKSVDARADGCIAMNADELLGAFGIKKYFDELSQWMIARFGLESARQGKFIRWAEYLNIPGPGTGHDGDPNISIVITDEIEAAVRELASANIQ